jgi:hypothetical protein
MCPLKVCDFIKIESLYDTLIKLDIPKTLIRLMKTYLDETQRKLK